MSETTRFMNSLIIDQEDSELVLVLAICFWGLFCHLIVTLSNYSERLLMCNYRWRFWVRVCNMEVVSLYAPIIPGQVKVFINDWRFIAFTLKNADLFSTEIFLLGIRLSDGNARTTSRVLTLT